MVAIAASRETRSALQEIDCKYTKSSTGATDTARTRTRARTGVRVRVRARTRVRVRVRVWGTTGQPWRVQGTKPRGAKQVKAALVDPGLGLG